MEKWEVLSQAMREENTDGSVFLAERISPEALRRAYEEQRAVFVEEDGRILGFAALWETAEVAWLEVGSLFVVRDARGRGLSSRLYPERLALIPPGIRSFVVTHRPEAAHLALRHGYVEATKQDWHTLAPYALVCGPCDRRRDDKLQCPLQAMRNECRLLVR